MQKDLFENEKMSDALQPALQQCSVSRSTFYQGMMIIIAGLVGLLIKKQLIRY